MELLEHRRREFQCHLCGKLTDWWCLWCGRNVCCGCRARHGSLHGRTLLHMYDAFQARPYPPRLEGEEPAEND